MRCSLLRIPAAVAVCSTLASAAWALAADDPRLAPLLGRMTLDEKIGQMVQVDSKALKGREPDLARYSLGSVLSGGSSDPADGNRAGNWRGMVAGLQAEAGRSRLRIPLLYGIDAVHGHNNVDGAVIFPHNIGLGATHDAALVEQAARVTAEETAATGIRWAFAPCIALARDDRWGRTYESFGDSTALVAELGAAAVRGLQGPRLSNPGAVLACAKHFLGDGGTQGGKDQGDTRCDEATLRRLFLPQYVDAIHAGVGSIMVSFSSWNGAKMHGNRHLLTGVLKGELAFDGFLVSDWAGIDQLNSDYRQAIEAAINAGVDMAMIPAGPGQPNNYAEFISDVKALVAAGRIAPARIDDAARRILRAKFRLGLFDPGATNFPPVGAVGSPAHRQVARQCVRESLVLLKNSRRTLPLALNLKRLQVVGAAADDLGVQCGGWTLEWQGRGGNVTSGGTTILAAIKAAVGTGTEVSFSPDGGPGGKPDAVIVVIGEKPYAEGKGDLPDLALPAADRELIKQAGRSGAPVITVLLSGRARVLDSALEDSDAFVAAWLPGTEGAGVADVLFGEFKPTGRLARAWPRAHAPPPAGSLPPGDAPLFPIGFGLAY
jgi:beta-glucosidase